MLVALERLTELCNSGLQQPSIWCLQLGTESREQLQSKEAELQVLTSDFRHAQGPCILHDVAM